MTTNNRSRRELLRQAIGGFSILQISGQSRLFGQQTGEVIPWLDQPAPNPNPAGVGKLLKWEELNTWYTPADNFFYAQHHGTPRLFENTYSLRIGGLVENPRRMTLADIKAREREEIDFTLECSGNTGGDFFIGGIGNARWAGARLAPLLEMTGIREDASEVIFYGADSGTTAIRDNPGIIAAGDTGSTEPDTNNQLDLTITEQFARSMSLSDALARDNLLCYEMNGQALPPENGYPVRLIAPGWYGIANVKWLTRIEVTDRRYTGRYMAREYVTVREQQHEGQTTWTFSNVGLDRLKSAPAKVTRTNGRYSITGAAWGAPIDAVEVQINDGPWLPTTLQEQPSEGRRARRYAWRFWDFDWATPSPGEYRIRSRATDEDGNVQPAANDASISSRRTYWENNGQIARRVRIA